MLYQEGWADCYLDRLFVELDGYAISKVGTIYVGGGTPTALNERQLERLLAKVSPYLASGGEFTVEANVENGSATKLDIMKNNGVNRLSLGIQSFDARLLRHMNRRHDEAMTANVVAMARKRGFSNINGDLIYDLPGQTDNMLLDDIKKMVSLGLPHIATYSLGVHPHTVYGLKAVKEASDAASRRHYDVILKELRHAGYVRYEVSNFAKPGFEGRHNQAYWNNEHYYGVGLGASGYLPGMRYANTRNLSAYFEGKAIAEREPIGPSDEETYYLMLKLRLEKGFAALDFKTRFGYAFDEKYQTAIADLKARGLLTSDGYRWYATDEGLMLLDRLVVTLLKEGG